MSVPARRRIRFVPLLAQEVDIQMELLAVRNEDTVRRAMFTDHLISVEEHLKWIAGLQSDVTRQIWVILDEGGKVIGQVSLHRLDRRNRTSDWAFFLTQAERGGLGFAVEYAFLEFVFHELGLAKLNCEVIEGNDAVVRLHGKFDFRPEGFRRSQLLKDGQRIGIHLLGLTSADWSVAREQIAVRHAAVLDRFAVDIVAGEIAATVSPT